MAAPQPADTPFAAIHSPAFPQVLHSAGICLLVSTYQAGKLMAVGEHQGAVWTLLRSFDRPMGLAARSPGQFVLGTRRQLWDFRNAPDIAPRLEPLGQHDACFLPRTAHVTGDILGHEMAWAGDELWIVNTLFSCLCTLHADYSFVPRWRPPFVTELTSEDRCHLNGLVVVDGQPKYATALGETNVPEGWRARKADGGIVLDIPSGQVIGRGLSMPHSPRVHAGRLWLLEGGTGRLQVGALDSCPGEIVAELPGFVRGLALHGRHAFVGLSKIRESALFGGLPIAERVRELQCGIWVVDLTTGDHVAWMQFQSGVDEIFAVEVLPGIRYPEILGFQDETLNRTYVLPAV